ncbi:MAG: ribosomal RNA small subunit methyltransferase A [Desulfobulbus sp.]|nr:ribosomal RNA small subunit methyltransferase A [Desulfobulbus sp.]
MSSVHTKQILKRQGLAPHKRLGQNFLVNPRTAQHIVRLAQLSPDDQVVEVGVGLGALTRPLAAAVRSVIGLEKDAGIIRFHQAEKDLPPNVRLVHADVLTVDLDSLTETGRRLKIVANLPYSISSPFLFRLIAHAHLMDFAVVMLQKEVALRLIAQPGSKNYGAPTVLLAACADVQPLLAVDPAEFHPRPKVDSLVVRIGFHPLPERVQLLGGFDRALFTKIVHAVFRQRRKTLLNGLVSAGFNIDKTALSSCLTEAGYAPQLRGETLALEDFIRLTHVLAGQDCSASFNNQLAAS